ncbi:MAG: succinate dehydrogenase assembly factor 2 [Legionella sp.]
MDSSRKAKLVWNCRRGMLELDLILSRFIPFLDRLTEEQFSAFEHLLTHPDPILYVWLIGQEEPNTLQEQEIVTLIRLYHNHTTF